MVSEKDIKENVTKNKTENLYELPTAGNVQSSNIRTRSRDGLRPSNSLPLERQGNDATFKERNTDQPNVNKNERVVRKERRPDRAVYVPKAGRSQSASEQKNQTNPKTNGTVQSNESGKTSQSDCYQEQILGNDAQIAADCFKDMAALSMKDEDTTYRRNDYEKRRSRKGLARHTTDEPYKDCDTSVKENVSTTRASDLERNQQTSQPNTNNTNAMQNNPQQDNKTALIESVICPPKEFEDDKEIIELEKMSKEINRSSRRIVKQTFNSDVLKIPDTVLSTDIEQYSELSKNKPDSDDWDTMFDDNGDCLNPDIMAELTATVGKVKIERPKADYKAYLVKQAILNEEEYPHVLEVSNFPVEFKTQDLMMVFSAYKESGFDIKWVDDTHALVVFSSSRIAAEVLSMSHPFVNLKPLADATAESKAKARKCAESLQPYRPRPETCAALARRLVSGALGVRLKTAAEERENEKKILREAKERKLLAAKQRDEVWES